MRTLIVDDKEENVYLLESLLKGSGHEVASAANGKEALAELRGESFDLIISDVLMPVMDGFALCQEVKSDEDLRTIPFIFYTATYKDAKDEEFALKLGADAFMRKPTEPDKFMEIIERVLEDSAKGRLPRAPSLSKGEEVYKLYNERLVAKLEHKMLAVEQEIVAREKSESRFRQVVDQAVDAIFVVNPDCQLIDTNQTACDFCGRTREELLTLSVTDISASDPGMSKQLWQVIEAGESATVEDMLLRKDGTMLPVELHIGLLKLENQRFMLVLARDITERKTVERAAQERKDRLQRENKALLELTSSRTWHNGKLEETLRSITETAALTLDVEEVGIWLLEEEDSKIRLIDQYTQSTISHSAGHVLRADEHPSYFKALESARVVAAHDVRTDPRTREFFDSYLSTRGSTSMLAAPIRQGDRLIGMVCHKHAGPKRQWTVEEQNFAGSIADMVSLAMEMDGRRQAELELRQSLRVAQDALQSTVRAIALITEMRDPYTAGHQERVTQLACTIAEQMGLPADVVEGVRVSGLLHDIGKISIPAEILSKPTRLTEVEFSLIQAHPETARVILSDIAFPWPVSQIAFQHHERLDGSGYPRGLKGEEILLEAQILAVADVVEAMSSHRPYRPALGIDAALEEISQGKGTKYNSAAVEVCIQLLKEKGFEFAA